MPIDPSQVRWDDAPDPARVKWDDEKKAPQWADLPANLLPSAGRFVGGIAQSVMHPIDTASGLLDLGAGALRNATPRPLRELIDKADATPAAAERASQTASRVGEFYADRYGSAEGAKRAVITDPVGVAADASMLLGGLGSMAKVGGLTKTADALNTASRYTNPLTAAAPVVRAGAKAAGTAAKNVLGLTTGVGAENVSQAFAAGKNKTPGFVANLKGDVPLTEVLDRAKQGLANMARQKSAEYRANMAAVKTDATVLKFDGIDDALRNAAEMVTYKGQVKNPRAAAAVQSMADDVARWKELDPAQFHTPEGLDALKQKLGATLEGIPFEEKGARLAASKVYNAVKSEITKQAPTYEKTMRQYSEASEQIGEIERALSLGDKAAKDTAMRKLQSLARNNVQTNYGNRLALAQELEKQGGVSLLPDLAGQAMNTWTPRSLAGQLGGLATGGATLLGSPQALLAMPLQSPKAVGLGAYGLGRGAGWLDDLLAKIDAEQAARLGLAGAQTQNAGLLP